LLYGDDANRNSSRCDKAGNHASVGSLVLLVIAQPTRAFGTNRLDDGLAQQTLQPTWTSWR
jgi:hypothetical protein